MFFFGLLFSLSLSPILLGQLIPLPMIRLDNSIVGELLSCSSSQTSRAASVWCSPPSRAVPWTPPPLPSCPREAQVGSPLSPEQPVAKRWLHIITTQRTITVFLFVAFGFELYTNLFSLLDLSSKSHNCLVFHFSPALLFYLHLGVKTRISSWKAFFH